MTADENEPVRTDRPRTPRRFGGIVRAVVALGAGVGLVYGATAATGTVRAVRASDTPSTMTSAAGARSQVICPGPDRPGSPGADDTDQTVQVSSALAPAGVVARGHADSPGGVAGHRLPRTAGGPVETAGTPGEAHTADVRGGGAAQIVGSGHAAAGLVALQSSHDSTTTARGLQLMQCRAATDDAWLLAGGSQPGRLARLVLTNPGDGPVSTDVTVLGASGVQKHHSRHDLVVPANGRTVVVLGDLGDDGAHPAVHVTADGGVVQASVVDRWMTGETRSGEALTGPAATPARTQVLPAVTDAGRAPVVRVAVPGGDETIVRVRAMSRSGKVVADRVTTVHGHSTAAVRLHDVERGVYSVRVTADEPVVAAASSRTEGSGTSDVAWMPSAPAIDDLTGYALPGPRHDGKRELVLRADGSPAKVSLVTTSRSGTDRKRTLTVPADRPVTVTVTDDASGWISVRHGTIRAGIVSTATDDDGPVVAATALHPVHSRADVTSAEPQTP